MRKIAIILFLTLLCVAVIGLFWRNEWVYSLPTPVPLNYMAVSPGSAIDFRVKFAPDNGKPLFLHFFNPDCPCSRFNIGHFKTLVKQYGKEVNFGIVVVNNNAYTAKEIQDKFDLTIPVSFDSAVAAACGVYSTPQAVIIDTNHKLYYRGNYNRTRYCADKKSEYARMALDSLLDHRVLVAFDRLAVTAYGCQLPSCKNAGQ
jgi:Redoxin